MTTASQTDDDLRQFYDEDQAETDFAFRSEVALLNKLNVAELRLLLVHYGITDARDAKTWSKADLVEGIAEHRIFCEARCP